MSSIVFKQRTRSPKTSKKTPPNKKRWLNLATATATEINREIQVPAWIDTDGIFTLLKRNENEASPVEEIPHKEQAAPPQKKYHDSDDEDYEEERKLEGESHLDLKSPEKYDDEFDDDSLSPAEFLSE